MKYVKSISLGLTMCGVVLIGSYSTFAEEVDNKTSTGNVEFEAPTTDALEIENYPSTIGFGVDTIKANGQEKNAEGTPSVQVNDLRGTSAGWQLQVSSTEFINDKDEDIKLKGVTIQFPAGHVKPVDNGNIATAPTPFTANIEASSSANAKNILAASEDTGEGGWILDWNNSENTNSEIQLKVPVARIGNYTATITWSLLDTPEK